MTSPTSFSESLGLVDPRTAIQKDSIDTALRNKLWDVTRFGFLSFRGDIDLSAHRRGEVYRQIWCDFFERASDRVPDYSSACDRVIREWFFAAEWNQVYDLLQYLLRECEPNGEMDGLVRGLNGFLAKNLSAYRWVGNSFVEIVDEGEIRAVETALTSPLAGVRAHLSKALRLLGDRTNPDEANSIKESVSAVEAVCAAILGKRDSLGAALTKLKSAGIDIHPALEDGWKTIYGYSSDADGIRHAMQDEPNLTVDDALYFLISCSAFVTLLTSKAREAGIELSTKA